MTALVALLGGWRATGFAVLLLGALLWTWVEAGRADHARAQAVRLQTEVDTANDRIAAFRMLLGQVNAAADQQIVDAKAQATAGKEAAEKAKAEAERLAGKLATTQARLEAAKADPGCAEQLRQMLCPAIPLL